MPKRYRVIVLVLTLGLIGVSVFTMTQPTIFIASLAALGVTLFFAGLMTLSHRESRVLLSRYERRLQTKTKALKDKDDVATKLTQHHPVGILLLSEGHVIAWANQAAKDAYANPLEGRSLEMIDKELLEMIERPNPLKTPLIKVYGQYYEVRYQPTMNAVYLTLVSEREQFKKRVYNAMSVVGLLHLDNLDDAFSVLDMQERSALQGVYLGALDDWAEAHKLYLIPITTSKLAFFAVREQLDALLANEFSIIKTVADLSREHDMMITLSGGVACATLSPLELGESAENALDLALSRGGDQVVVNNEGEALRMFGGNANTQEKRTRISSRLNAQKLNHWFGQTNAVYITPHKYPDTDALGGAIGLLKMALAAKKEAYIIIDVDAVDKSVRKIITQIEYEYVTLLDNFIAPEDALEQIQSEDLLLLVDHHSYGQMIEPNLLNMVDHVGIIDHHRKLSDALTETVIQYIEPYASSSTELIVEMINVFPLDVTLNPFEATVLLSGIIVDTNNFMYRTGSRTYEAAATLRKFGADSFKVKNILREPLAEIQLKSRLLAHAEVVKKRFSLVVIPEDVALDRTLLAKMADTLLTIDNTVAGFAIGQLSKDEVGISARSLDDFNVQVLMEKFGGGGHLNNAAAQVNKKIDTVKSELIELLEQASMEEKPMKVILLKDLKNKGKKDEVIEVPAGYGNYLLTSKQAIEATSENLSVIESQKQKQKEDAQAELEAMQALKERLDYRAVKLFMKMGKNGKLFGKITSKQMADALKEQHDITVDKRKINTDQKIDALGTYTIEVKLHKNVSAQFELLVLEEQ